MLKAEEHQVEAYPWRIQNNYVRLHQLSAFVESHARKEGAELLRAYKQVFMRRKERRSAARPSGLTRLCEQQLLGARARFREVEDDEPQQDRLQRVGSVQ